jgi:translocator protein
MKDLKMLVAFILVCELAGAIGALFTTPSIPVWYASLQKPTFSPPSWVFFPVWTTLYAMMGIACYLVWEKGFGKKEVRDAISVFFAQLVLNAGWSIAFFGLRSPLAGLAMIALLWLAIAWSAILFHRISKTAGLLMIPYLAWVSFASVLNLAIVLLNP